MALSNFFRTPFKTIYNVCSRLYNYNFGFYGYYNIPFKFPKPLPPNSVAVLKKGCAMLDALGVKHCVSFGTLLGIYRDNRLIPHDSDLDIEAVHPVDTGKIEKEFVANGFKLGAKIVALGVVQKLAFYTEDEVVFDIELYQRIGDFVYSFHDKNLYFKFPAEYYENFEQRPFSGYMVHVPRNPESWLEYTYGKNWRVPKMSKRDFNEEKFFDEEGYGMHVKVEGDILAEIGKIKKAEQLRTL